MYIVNQFHIQTKLPPCFFAIARFHTIRSLTVTIFKCHFQFFLCSFADFFSECYDLNISKGFTVIVLHKNKLRGKPLQAFE